MQEDVGYKTNAVVLAEIRCDQALELIDAGDYAAAVDLFRACLAVDPGMLDAMYGLIRALQNTGQFDEAIKIAHRLILLDPDNVLAHTGLSILYQQKGMIPEAEAEATRARVLDWQQAQHDLKPGVDL